MLTVHSAFLVFFSEKFPGYRLVDVGGVDAHVNRDFGARGLNDMDVSAMQWSQTDAAPARGRSSWV